MHRFVSMKQSCNCARVRVGRAEALGHWRLRWHAVLVRGSRLRQRLSRAARRGRLHQHRTKKADALCSTVDPGCGNENRHPEAPPPLWRLRLHNRTLLEVGHPQLSEELAGSPIAAALTVHDSRPCALRRAESQLSTRQLRRGGLNPSTRVRGLLDSSLLRGAYPFRARFGRAYPALELRAAALERSHCKDAKPNGEGE